MSFATAGCLSLGRGLGKVLPARLLAFNIFYRFLFVLTSLTPNNYEGATDEEDGAATFISLPYPHFPFHKIFSASPRTIQSITG